LLRQLWFYLACLPLLCLRRSPSLFVTQTNPPLIVPLVALMALLHRRPFVIIAQDIYPEVMFAHGMSAPDSIPGRMLKAVFRWAYRRAAKVVALGDVMAERLKRKGVESARIVVISNWATGAESVEHDARNTLRAKWELTGQFVILYSGNLGIAHDVETPIAALKLLLDQVSNVRLVFIGKGSRLADAQQAAAAAGVAHAVQFRPPVPADWLPQTLGLADIALATLRPGFEGLVVPSKVLGYMARGLPTLYVGPHSDIEQFLGRSQGGLSFRNGAVDELAASLQTLVSAPERLRAMGEAAERYYHATLSQSQGLHLYGEVVRSVLGEALDA
jgi:glycosyltransferase involved in cell wall biosynthesis